MRQRIVLLFLSLGVIVLGVSVLGHDILVFFSDLARIREVVQALGPWGPVGLVILSAVQIVLAPVPGYLVQVAGGYLFGPWAGAAYGLVGMALGATAAFLLARRLGVPLLERLVPHRLLTGWLRLRHLDSMAAWIIILLLPVGDFCYFLAGLTSLSLSRMLTATLLVRGPTVIIAAVAGAQAVHLPAQWLGVLVVGLIILSLLILWQKDRLEMLVFERLLLRILGKRDGDDE